MEPLTPGGADWIREKQFDAHGNATVVLTDEGWSHLAASGRRRFVADLCALGVGRGEAPPTSWRFVRRLPGPRQDHRPLFPHWRLLDRSAARWRGEADVRTNLAVLEGHFPGEPVVPGVAQLFWAERVARGAFPGYAATGEVARIKFARIIVPGMKLRLGLDNLDGATVAFRYTSEDGLHSSGNLVRRPL